MKLELHKKLLLSLLAVAAFCVASFAEIPAKPDPPRLVNDFASAFTSEQADSLERKLDAVDDTTGNQICIVTVTSLDGMEPAEYARDLFRAWGIGNKKTNNGVLILYKPKTEDSYEGKGRVFIMTGYGLEGAIPDAVCNRIVENEMIPHFKDGDIYAGFEQAVNTLIPLATGEYSSDAYMKADEPSAWDIIVTIIFIFFFPVFYIVFMIIRAIRRSMLIKNGITPQEDWVDRMRTQDKSGKHYHNYGGGGGWFGGGSGGGGFGGFGGGSTGGGGAGGSW